MEVQNDKAVVEVPCPVNGTVLEVLAKDGQVCHMGEVVAIIDAEGISRNKLEPAEEAKEESVAAAPAAEAPKADGTAAPNHEVLATPSVRKLAREKGVNIGEVPPTGKNGKITREEVEAFANGGAPVAKESSSSRCRSQSSTCRSSSSYRTRSRRRARAIQGIRKAISNAMVKSAYTAPHVTIMDEVTLRSWFAFRTA